MKKGILPRMKSTKPIVMKFGGASVRDATAVGNAAGIVGLYRDRKLVVVFSAMGKTTNELETLAALAKDQKERDAGKQLLKIRNTHEEIVAAIFPKGNQRVIKKLRKYFDEIEQIIQGILLLGEFPPRTYDRIVAFGELISSSIMFEALKATGLDCEWIDVRDIIKTDSSHQDARVIWSLTTENTEQKIVPLLKSKKIVVTQGFIASGIDGKVTTLGREGSDYTAAIFASILDAESLIVWKDVPGILNGDPRILQNRVLLDEISYEHAVEMTFYGATVIHPKTIKPLYQKNIPLFVMPFSNPKAAGTKIANAASGLKSHEGITSTIIKNNQVVIRILPKDISFMEAELVSGIYAHIVRAGIRVNLVQTSAISFILCADNNVSRIQEFISLLLDQFEVEVRPDLELVTFIDFSLVNLRTAANAVMVQQSENKLFVVRNPGGKDSTGSIGEVGV